MMKNKRQHILFNYCAVVFFLQCVSSLQEKIHKIVSSIFSTGHFVRLAYNSPLAKFLANFGFEFQSPPTTDKRQERQATAGQPFTFHVEK